MKATTLPFKYLGVHIHKGVTRMGHCKDLLQAFDNKLNSWGQKMLSQGGRLILIKHVLGSIPLHILAVTGIPQTVKSMLNKKISNFFWGFKDNRPKQHWISFKKMCRPTESGGVGIRSFDQSQQVSALKLWWEFQVGQSNWAFLMRNKYGRRTLGEAKSVDSPTWKTICQISVKAEAMVDRGDSSIKWKHTSEGVFSSKSAYKAITQEGRGNLTYTSIWHRKQVPKIKVFLWRLWHKGLPFPGTNCQILCGIPISLSSLQIRLSYSGPCASYLSDSSHNLEFL
ncbi:unnamed protein product [Cuscuta epithymum]|uniref:Reverse transcriptase zinc-binding domain-containing protein n=1 Tax=Cuscuta epithymum TaxID=186058 RepID=A0AAV0GK65_9ASTE|nr:unnamed protein product [Cuscuta epithymum]